MEFDKTMSFEVEREENTKCQEILKDVYQALVEKGYNPINQIVGYILSGDPTYITSHNDARNKIRTIERDELLEKMVKLYRTRKLIMRMLGIDYGEARVGTAITDELNITVQGLETIQRNNSDKIVLKRLDEIFEKYEVDTIVVGMPLNMNGTISERAKITEQFIHKLKCKYNKKKIETIDERLTTVEAHKTMNFLDVKKTRKRSIVDTISAVYILETYLNKCKNTMKN